ncbi:MAG: hypothetical protein WCH43_13540, partial [Verrucomicrobiota bacterium]
RWALARIGFGQAAESRPPTTKRHFNCAKWYDFRSTVTDRRCNTLKVFVVPSSAELGIAAIAQKKKCGFRLLYGIVYADFSGFNPPCVPDEETIQTMPMETV